MPQLNLPNIKKTQKERILQALNDNKRDFNQGWIRGVDFINGNFGKPILQYHARIFELQQAGYLIASAFKENDNFKSYRLLNPPKDDINI